MSGPLLNLLGAIVLILLPVLVLWPGWGLVARFQRARLASRRMVTEDLLKSILKAEVSGRPVTIEGLAGTTGTDLDRIAEILQEMEAGDLISLEGGIPRLQRQGREAALHIVRAHRLWERYLADRTGTHELSWHDEAERVEHELSANEVRELAAELGNPAFDPHGDPIPAEGDPLWSLGGIPITDLEEGQTGRIVHVEDEPATVYAQLVAEGLTPGMTAHLVDKSASRIHFWADGNEITLAPIVAANVTVRVLESEISGTPHPTVTLSDIKPGEQATVIGISRTYRGPMRRRLLDLGVVPGTVIVVERTAPGGDPVAYRIRGATIALRHSQARFINVELVAQDRDIDHEMGNQG